MAHHAHVSRLRRAGLISALSCLLATPSAWAQGTALEMAVKATYLYKMAAFIVWPPTTPPLASFHLCVIASDTFGAVLDQAIQGQTVAGLPIVATRLRSLPDRLDCQMLYIADPDTRLATTILAATRGRPIVTVTDGASDPDARGIINFVIADNRVRFEIDNRAAVQSQLTISSKLLSLAVRVNGTPLRGEDR